MVALGSGDAPPPPGMAPLEEERNVGLLVTGCILLGLSPFALVGGTVMGFEGKGEDRDIGTALQVLGGSLFGFGLGATIIGAIPVNVEADPTDSARVRVQLGAGSAALTGSF